MSVGQDIKDAMKEASEVLAETPAVLEAFGKAILTLRSIFGWNRKQAAAALADHVDPSKTENPRVAAALDAGKPNPTA